MEDKYIVVNNRSFTAREDNVSYAQVVRLGGGERFPGRKFKVTWHPFNRRKDVREMLPGETLPVEDAMSFTVDLAD